MRKCYLKCIPECSKICSSPRKKYSKIDLDPPKNLPKSWPSRLQNEGRLEHGKRFSPDYGIREVWATQNRTPEQLQKTVKFLFISDMRFHTILKPFWVPSWGVLGPSLAVSVALKRDPESNRFLDASWDLILVDFHRF